jgi:hypothetical protein
MPSDHPKSPKSGILDVLKLTREFLDLPAELLFLIHDELDEQSRGALADTSTALRSNFLPSAMKDRLTAALNRYGMPSADGSPDAGGSLDKLFSIVDVALERQGYFRNHPGFRADVLETAAERLWFGYRPAANPSVVEKHMEVIERCISRFIDAANDTILADLDKPRILAAVTNAIVVLKPETRARDAQALIEDVLKRRYRLDLDDESPTPDQHQAVRDSSAPILAALADTVPASFESEEERTAAYQRYKSAAERISADRRGEVYRRLTREIRVLSDPEARVGCWNRYRTALEHLPAAGQLVAYYGLDDALDDLSEDDSVPIEAYVSLRDGTLAAVQAVARGTVDPVTLGWCKDALRNLVRRILTEPKRGVAGPNSQQKLRIDTLHTILNVSSEVSASGDQKDRRIYRDAIEQMTMIALELEDDEQASLIVRVAPAYREAPVDEMDRDRMGHWVNLIEALGPQFDAAGNVQVHIESHQAMREFISEFRAKTGEYEPEWFAEAVGNLVERLPADYDAARDAGVDLARLCQSIKSDDRREEVADNLIGEMAQIGWEDDIAPEDVRQAFGQLAATLSLETLDEIPEEVATALGIRPQQAR